MGRGSGMREPPPSVAKINLHNAYCFEYRFEDLFSGCFRGAVLVRGGGSTGRNGNEEAT